MRILKPQFASSENSGRTFPLQSTFGQEKKKNTPSVLERISFTVSFCQNQSVPLCCAIITSFRQTTQHSARGTTSKQPPCIRALRKQVEDALFASRDDTSRYLHGQVTWTFSPNHVPCSRGQLGSTWARPGSATQSPGTLLCCCSPHTPATTSNNTRYQSTATTPATDAVHVTTGNNKSLSRTDMVQNPLQE